METGAISLVIVVALLLVLLVASRGRPRRSLCKRRAQAPTAGRQRRQHTRQCTTPIKAGPHRRRCGASCSSQSSTGLADRGFLPPVSQSWRLASDELPAD